jgi:hypothetical protein
MNWHPCYDATRSAFLAPRLRTDAGVNLWPPAGLAVDQLHCHHSHCLPQSWSPLMDQMQIQLQEEKLYLLDVSLFRYVTYAGRSFGGCAEAWPLHDTQSLPHPLTFPWDNSYITEGSSVICVTSDTGRKCSPLVYIDLLNEAEQIFLLHGAARFTSNVTSQ